MEQKYEGFNKFCVDDNKREYRISVSEAGKFSFLSALTKVASLEVAIGLEIFTVRTTNDKARVIFRPVMADESEPVPGIAKLKLDTTHGIVSFKSQDLIKVIGLSFKDKERLWFVARYAQDDYGWHIFVNFNELV